MNQSSPPVVIAGDREAGALCPHCDSEIEAGEKTIACPDCGNVQHWTCWTANDGCGAYECAPVSAAVPSGDVLKISDIELEKAVPLATGAAYVPRGPALSVPVGPPVPLGWNRLAITAFIIAVLGTVGFGLVTGLIAVVLGGVALIGRAAFRKRGIGLAVAAIVLGIFDFIGWAVFLYSNVDLSQVVVQLDDFEPDPAALTDLPEHLNRAMKANVLITVKSGLTGLLGHSIGAGVILRIKANEALIVTNRHVVDDDFASGTSTVPEPLPTVTGLLVKLLGQPPVPGKLVWLAPEGIDLALVTVPVMSTEVLSAPWDAEPRLKIGENVFAVGNPHGLAWTHTGGDISQIRRQTRGPTEFRVIQTSAAINPGNSGGGLYDSAGHLLGINTWTHDKRMADGLSFAIAFETLLKLAPAKFELPASHTGSNEP